MPYRRIEPKQWPARNEVRALARQHTVEAMNKLIELMGAESKFVAMNAARAVLMQGQPEPRQNPRFRRIGLRGASEVNVKIARFSKEKKSAGKKRDRGLPVVPGRRKGPRDAGDAGGAGLPALQGQRADICDEPRVGHGPAPGLPGSGTASGPGRRTPATGVDREPARKTRRKKAQD
jgi:hypothetical protein